ADLRGSRAPWPPARHPCRIDLSPLHYLAGLAELLHRGLCQPHPGLPVAGGEPGLRRRVRKISGAEGRAARIRGDVAPGLPVAVLENLAPRAPRGGPGWPPARGGPARPYPPPPP